MTDQRGDRDLCEAQVVRDAREAVSQNVRGYVPKRRVLEHFLPTLWEVPDGVVQALAGEYIRARPPLSFVFEILDNRQSDRTNGRPLLAIDQPQAATLKIDLAPFEIYDFSATAASQRDQPEDVGVYAVVVALLRLAKCRLEPDTRLR